MVFSVAASIVFGYAVFLGFIYITQDSMVYFPVRELFTTPKQSGMEYEEVFFKTPDGINISAWHIPSKPGIPERGSVLFCHGNAGNISHRIDSIRIFHELGLSVLIFDYRGYGKSEGRPSENGTYLDAEAAWDHLTATKKVRPEKIILFGRSLGSAVASELALRKKVGALIIESGFTSLPELGSAIYPYIPVRFIAKYKYATADKVGQIKIPKLFIHSPGDRIVPFAQGRGLYEKAADPKEFLEIKGGHNDGFMVSGRLYTDGLNKFITDHFATD
ncbi:MAG: alpha/beta hydrolase [Nitrospirae bacterium]|nr:MAG: alpha/beta hydrolase [Nitrospirota bacterium]